MATTAQEAVAEMLKEFEREFMERVMRRTPIDKGKAREGWQSQVNKEQLVISNDVPYIGELENGSSKQAPSGMLRITVEESQQIVEAAAKKTHRVIKI